MTDLSSMTQERWNKLSREERHAYRDRREMHIALDCHEGQRCVLRTPRENIHGRKQWSFIVGITTGWRPAHMAMRRGSIGSSDLIKSTERLDILRFEEPYA